jgi:hypothetical protein
MLRNIIREYQPFSRKVRLYKIGMAVKIIKRLFIRPETLLKCLHKRREGAPIAGTYPCGIVTPTQLPTFSSFYPVNFIEDT